MTSISIVVPVFRVRDKLTKCVDSILSQTYCDFELILVDDGSDDGSGEICDRLSQTDNRIRVIHKENGGVSSARNAGIGAVTGKYLSFVDSDDYLHPEFLQKLVNAAEQNEADFVMCGYTDVNTGETVRHEWECNRIYSRKDIRDEIFTRIVENERTCGLYSVWNKLFRFDVIQKNSIKFSEEMSFGEDALFVIEYLKQASAAVFLPDALYFYESEPTGLFSRYREKFIDDVLAGYRVITSLLPGKSSETSVSLEIKYYNYINRYLSQVYQNEKNVIGRYVGVFHRKEVSEIYKRILSLDADQLEEFGLDAYDRRIPSLVTKGFYLAAAIYKFYTLRKSLQ